MPQARVSTEGQLPELYARSLAARKQAQFLVGELQATKRKTTERWQLIQDSWTQTELIQARREASRIDPGQLRYSAYARLQARLASMPVIEQAKGIIMARRGCSEDQAFAALVRASQRENVKARDLAASIVARTVRSASPARQAGSR